MRYGILILLMVFLPVSVFCQALESVWGIKFGLSKDSVIKSVKDKTGKTPMKDNENKNIVSYEKVQFGGREADVIVLKFYNNKFYGCGVLFIPDKEPKLLSLYEGLKTDIQEKWFSPQVNAERYTYPYDNDNTEGERIVAIKGGYATIGATWFFPRTATKNIAGQITITINPDMYVQIFYIDGDISKDADAIQNQKDKSDF